MPLCAGLVGPKSENVEISLVLPLLFEGPRCQKGFSENEQMAEKWRLWHRKSRFLVKNASCRFGELCFLLRQEAHFCKTCENYGRKVKNAPKKLRWRVWCLCVRAWWGRKVKILRIHRLRSVLSGPVNSKPTLLRRILLLQRGPRYDEKGNRRDKGAIGAKKCLRKRLYPTLFDVEKVDLLLQNAWYRFWKLCFLLGQEAHVCKNDETCGRKVKNAPWRL